MLSSGLLIIIITLLIHIVQFKGYLLRASFTLQTLTPIETANTKQKITPVAIILYIYSINIHLCLIDTTNIRTFSKTQNKKS